MLILNLRLAITCQKLWQGVLARQTAAGESRPLSAGRRRGEARPPGSCPPAAGLDEVSCPEPGFVKWVQEVIYAVGLGAEFNDLLFGEGVFDSVYIGR